MKIRTKLLTAVLASATALSCALTASALDTSITLNNNVMPATLDGDTTTATLTLKASDFKDVRGAKITITLPYTMTLEEAEIVDSGWTAGTNYKVDKTKNTVTLVDVFNFDNPVDNLSLNLKLKVKGAAMGDNAITISGDLADAKADEVYNPSATANLVVGKEIVTSTGATAAETAINAIDKEQFFIPEGGVYTDNGNDTYSYAKKNADGSFDFTNISSANNVQFIKCKLPTDKAFTTFSSSKKAGNTDSTIVYEKSNGIQFGTYFTEAYVPGKYGTLVIKGDYNAFRNYYGKTDAELLAKIMQHYNSLITAEGAALTLQGGANSITVKKVAQTKLMWKGNSAFQYAVRLYGLEKTDESSYTAVAYSDDNGVYTFSNEIQTKVNPFYTGTAQ